MCSSSFLCLSFLGVVLFNEFQWIHAGRHRKGSEDLTSDPHLGRLPPHPGEQDSQVPPNWRWQPVLVDDLCSDHPHTRDRAGRTFQKNTIYSILFDQERQARNQYEAKEQEHIRNKQIQYNKNMRKQWKKERENSLPSKCIISRR